MTGAFISCKHYFSNVLLIIFRAVFPNSGPGVPTTANFRLRLLKTKKRGGWVGGFFDNVDIHDNAVKTFPVHMDLQKQLKKTKQKMLYYAFPGQYLVTL